MAKMPRAVQEFQRKREGRHLLNGQGLTHSVFNLTKLTRN